MSWHAGHPPLSPPQQPGTKASTFGWGMREDIQKPRLRELMLKGLNVTTASCVTSQHPGLAAVWSGSAYPRYYCTEALAEIGGPCLGDEGGNFPTDRLLHQSI